MKDIIFLNESTRTWLKNLARIQKKYKNNPAKLAQIRNQLLQLKSGNKKITADLENPEYMKYLNTIARKKLAGQIRRARKIAKKNNIKLRINKLNPEDATSSSFELDRFPMLDGKIKYGGTLNIPTIPKKFNKPFRTSIADPISVFDSSSDIATNKRLKKFRNSLRSHEITPLSLADTATHEIDELNSRFNVLNKLSKRNKKFVKNRLNTKDIQIKNHPDQFINNHFNELVDNDFDAIQLISNQGNTSTHNLGVLDREMKRNRNHSLLFGRSATSPLYRPPEEQGANRLSNFKKYHNLAIKKSNWDGDNYEFEELGKSYRPGIVKNAYSKLSDDDQSFVRTMAFRGKDNPKLFNKIMNKPSRTAANVINTFNVKNTFIDQYKKKHPKASNAKAISAWRRYKLIQNYKNKELTIPFHLSN